MAMIKKFENKLKAFRITDSHFLKTVCSFLRIVSEGQQGSTVKAGFYFRSIAIDERVTQEQMETTAAF